MAESMALMCELCDSEEGIRRDDNIYVCDSCNNKYPIKEVENGKD